jgi:hypothetical protein
MAMAVASTGQWAKRLDAGSISGKNSAAKSERLQSRSFGLITDKR